MREKILLIGGGGHCKSCIDVIEREGKYEIAGIIDKKDLMGQKVLAHEIIGCDDDLPSLINVRNILVTVGQIKSPSTRIKLYDYGKDLGFNFPTIISPQAYVSKYAQVGEGTIIMHDALINAGACVGANCIINSKVLVEHDAVVEDHCHISTAAVLNGGATVRRGTFWGSGTVSTEGAATRENDFIKAGSLFKADQQS